jgi:hypothetical protein
VGDRLHRQVGQDRTDRLVEGLGSLLAPRRHLLGHPPRDALQRAGVAQLPPRLQHVGRPMGPGPEVLAFLPRPLQPPRLLEIGDDGVGKLEQVLHVGRRVRQLGVGERPEAPVGEPVPLRHLPAEERLGERGQAGRGVPGEAGRDLGVEQPARAPPAGPLEDLEVLVGGVGDHGRGAGQHLGEGGHVDGERIDERDLGNPGSARFGPGDLQQGQRRPVRPLPVELGVEGVAVRAAQAINEILESGLFGDQFDPTLLRRDDTTRVSPRSSSGCPPSAAPRAGRPRLRPSRRRPPNRSSPPRR